LDDAADALAAGLATGIGRFGVRLRVEYQSAAAAPAGEPLVTLLDYRYVPDTADFFVEEPSVEDLTAAALAGGHIATRLLPEHPVPGRSRKRSSYSGSL
jgi:hypothetical protein